MHCNLFSREALKRVGDFDEALTGARAEVDLSLALHAAGIRVVFEPASQVTFSGPPPVHPEEREYYLRYWDIEGNAADHRRIESRWNLVECPDSMEFVKARRHILDADDPEEQVRREHDEVARQIRAAKELAEFVPQSDLVVLVDDCQWRAPEIAGPRPTLPFLEKDGQYWGPPEDDATAIAELERLRENGASFLAFGWPAFWWLDCYRGFVDYLQHRYPCVLDNERLVLFDLRNHEPV
jgi:hypothetical protein